MRTPLISLAIAAVLAPWTGAVQVPAAGGPRITPDQAAVRAHNDLRQTADGVRLAHRAYQVAFAPDELAVRPRRGPAWRWRLTRVRGESGAPVPGVSCDATAPRIAAPTRVAYRRGRVEEQYVVLPDSIEQRFVLERELGLGGEDLVIEGAVTCAGAFERTPSGWRWYDALGAVTLGTVYVYDSRGEPLPATMEVDRRTSRIRVDGAALARAAYPVVVDPEIGPNDFRISDMGPDGDVLYDAENPAVAYNPIQNEYLVVWAGDDAPLPLSNGRPEIFGQRIDAATGQEVGPNDFLISDPGPCCSGTYSSHWPAVVYNPAHHEYLVVWREGFATVQIVEGNFDIHGQRLDAATGLEVGPNDFPISDVGSGFQFQADAPALAYNSTDDEYLVVWPATTDNPALHPNEYEVYGQRLDWTGAEIGADDFRISDMGPDGDLQFQVGPIQFNGDAVALAYNAVNNECFVVWAGNDDTPPLTSGQFHIFGQRIDAATGAEVGLNDVLLSDPPAEGEFKFDLFPSVAHGTLNNEYVVVWSSFLGISNIRGRRLDGATGTKLGTGELSISGPDPAGVPAITYDASHDEYLVTWNGSIGGESEALGQRIEAATGTRLPPFEFRISETGPAGPSAFGVFNTASAFNPLGGEYLVVWSGGGPDSPTSSENGEFEIYGQRLVAGPPPLTGDVNQISLVAGGSQILALDAGLGNAFGIYFLLGSISGYDPGVDLGGETLPLNVDAYFQLTLTQPSSFLSNTPGFLDTQGRATVQLIVPPGTSPAFAGFVVHHAYGLLLTPFASNPISCTLVP